MTIFAVLRHGPTEWSATRRLQGRSDIPLSPAGRATVASWRLPPPLAGCAWLTSPLARAIETAEILGLTARREARLIEMAWGEWEGLTLAELAAHPGAALAEREPAGLDFQPQGGESPRQVQARLQPLLAEIARASSAPSSPWRAAGTCWARRRCGSTGNRRISSVSTPPAIRRSSGSM
jgi:broad specificity phosphatase PhoE